MANVRTTAAGARRASSSLAAHLARCCQPAARRDREFSRILLAAAAALLLSAAGCAGEQKKALSEALFDFQRGLRWGKVDLFAAHLKNPRRRAVFAARRDEVGDLRIVACDFGKVLMKGEKQAVVTLRFDWFLLRHGTAHTTVVMQTWQLQGGKWRVVGQRWLRGARMPLLEKRAAPRVSLRRDLR